MVPMGFSGCSAGSFGSSFPSQANLLTFNSSDHSAVQTGYPPSQGFVGFTTSTGYTGYPSQFGHGGHGASFSTPQTSSNWYFDSGASTHVTHDLANLT